MKHRIGLFILILTLQTIGSGAWADCGFILTGEKKATLAVGARVEKFWKVGRQLVPYTALGAQRNRRGYYNVSDILPEKDQSHSLILGIQNEHPYVWYKGYRLDTDGEAGIKVITKMTKSRFLYGEAMFVIRDMPAEAIANLDRAIEHYERKSFISCARAACSYINQADTSILDNRNFRTTSKIMKALAAEKIRGRAVDIYVMGNVEMKDIYKNITDTEVSVQTNIFVGGMIVSVIPTTFLAVLVQMIQI